MRNLRRPWGWPWRYILRALWMGMTHPFSTENDRQLWAWKQLRQLEKEEADDA
jgi:hypothetical protein